MKKQKKFSIIEEVASGDWFQYDNDLFKENMKIRFISFREVQIEEIDRIEDIEKAIPIRSGRIFLLSTEIVNMSKQAVSEPRLSLLDEDDFEYNDIIDSSLRRSTDFSDRYHFNVNLIPKFKYTVDYIFLVPPEDTRYYFQASYGKLKKV